MEEEERLLEAEERQENKAMFHII